jgi:hypothetical protein
VGVHKKCELQVLWIYGVRFLRVKQKLEVGFCGGFFVSFFAAEKKKMNLKNLDKVLNNYNDVLPFNFALDKHGICFS